MECGCVPWLENLILSLLALVAGPLLVHLARNTRATLVANYNYVQVSENLGVNIDVRRGTTRSDGFLGVQELFYERKLADLARPLQQRAKAASPSRRHWRRNRQTRASR